MKKDILFSFVLPAYKDTYFEDAIKSILSQTYTKFELIVVDDASPYDLKKILDKFSDSRISYYRNEKNIGGENLIKQWNHCIEYAHGDYIILAADDDIYSEVFLEESIKLINEHPEVNVIRGRLQNIDTNNVVTRIDIQLPSYISFDEFLFAESFLLRCIGNYVFKASVLLEQKFIDYPLAWWSDLATVLKLINDNLCITKLPVYSFRKSTEHISSIKSKTILVKKIISTKLFFDDLKIRLSAYNKSDDSLKKEIYKKFIKENDMLFKEILKLVRQASILTMFPLINTIYKKNIISRKEKYKLFYYYCFRKRM